MTSSTRLDEEDNDDDNFFFYYYYYCHYVVGVRPCIGIHQQSIPVTVQLVGRVEHLELGDIVAAGGAFNGLLRTTERENICSSVGFTSTPSLK